MLASASTHHLAITLPTSLTISSRRAIIRSSARARSIAASSAWPSGVSGSSSANAKRSLDRVRPLLQAVRAERCAIVVSRMVSGGWGLLVFGWDVGGRNVLWSCRLTVGLGL